MNVFARRLAGRVVAIGFASLAQAALGADFSTLAALAPKAFVATGDTARLQQVFAKAAAGGTVTVAVIGGSITAGAQASKPDARYANRIAAWWRTQFPGAKVALVNAGIGATGSNFGALRARRDLLSKQPDFVVVEYAVNDGPTRDHAESLEGVLRQILAEPQQPAVVLLFMMNQKGGNAQEWHAKVGAHYALPMVSYRDALWPEIEAKRLAWTDLSPDEVHPNDLGHELAAHYVTTLLARIRTAATGPIAALPAPLVSDLYANTTLLEAADLKPAQGDGWSFDATNKAWSSAKPGSVVTFEVSGRMIMLMHYRLHGAMGKARVQVDEAEPRTLDGWFSGTWGGYRETTILARDLKPGPHRVRIELLEEKSAESTGHEFRVLAIGAAGTDQ